MIRDSMRGLDAADVERWSPLVTVVRGLNPGPFTGPGTNTYLIGRGPKPLLLDTGSGREGYVPLLEKTLADEHHSDALGDIALTHVHPDHIGGARSILDRLGPRQVFKRPWPGEDERFDLPLTPIDDGHELSSEGATLRAIHTPGHAEDHLCFYLEEEKALFTGDLVLGAGTTVIPLKGGDMGHYLESLTKLLDLDLERIYPGHGPLVSDPKGRLRDYIAHRLERERQVVEAIKAAPLTVERIVERIYVDTPKFLYPAAAQSVLSHLLKLERESRVVRSEGGADPDARWSLA